jgi:hypothetical protein
MVLNKSQPKGGMLVNKSGRKGGMAVKINIQMRRSVVRSPVRVSHCVRKLMLD